mgnify:CR=1 FL=1
MSFFQKKAQKKSNFAVSPKKIGVRFAQISRLPIQEGSIFSLTHPSDLPHFLRKTQVFGHFGRKFLSELDKKADFCEKNVHFGGPLDDESPARGPSQNYEAV